MPRVTSIQIGEIYGRLTVVKKIPNNALKNPKRTLFECLCTCGATAQVDAGNLKGNKVRSCGCLQKELAREKGRRQKTRKSYLNLFWSDYRKGARDRSIPFLLPRDVFESLLIQDCHYCGAFPSRVREIGVGLPFPVGGIDRIDSSGPYSPENCVPCCADCNTMKMGMSKEAFLKKVTAIALRLEGTFTLDGRESYEPSKD